MHRIIIVLLVAVALIGLPACQHSRPPAELVKAMKTVEGQVDVYVEESNWALEKAEHPDREVLIGTGLRIRNAVKALSWWAQEVSGAAAVEASKEKTSVKPTP